MSFRDLFPILVFALFAGLVAGIGHAASPGPAPEGMVWIPGGEFIMGSPKNEPGREGHGVGNSI